MCRIIDINPMEIEMQTEATQPAADTAPVLTIDTKDLRDLFLPSLKRHHISKAYLEDECVKLGRQCNFDMEAPAYGAVLTASCCVGNRLSQLVDIIHRRGGLLLIGGAV